ncbi:MAG: isochorismatase family protein [Clostridiales bacterium]|nr:isochorismatase family protein [Clostridiales bacterium]
MRITKDNAIAICVDYQERLMPAIHDKEEVLRKSEILVKGLRALEIPILVTQQYTRGLGATVEPIHSALGEYEPFDKLTFGAYDTPEFKELVDAAGKKNVLVFGAETHICVLQTALGLADAGYHVIMVEDCCGSRTPENKESGLRRAMCEGVAVACMETVLFELTHIAGNDTFKTISKLVK